MSIFVHVNLNDCYTNKAIIEDLSLINEVKIENIGLGPFLEFFKSSSLPKSLELVFIENVSFIFPELMLNKYDNVECKEQKITVRKGNYSNIHILGFSTYGSFIDEIKLIYSNGIIENATLSFLDWFNPIQTSTKWEFSNFISINPKKVIKAKQINNNDAIYCYDYYKIINNNLELVDIQLPYNPCIHLFAITLEIYK